MNILKNKHLVLAMFVAPVLAIIAYFATDHIVSEKPKPALQGGAYKLAALSNCRYQSGKCTLKNGDVEVRVRVSRLTENIIELNLQTSMPAQNVVASFVSSDATQGPVTMQSFVPEKDSWSATFDAVDPVRASLRLVIELSGSSFYAETPAVFIDYQTTYSRENFSE